MPDPNSVMIMRAVDRLSPAMRVLVREFGFTIVASMIDEGYTNACDLRPLLETWRERRQEEWLATDYLISKRKFG